MGFFTPRTNRGLSCRFSNAALPVVAISGGLSGVVGLNLPTLISTISLPSWLGSRGRLGARPLLIGRFLCRRGLWALDQPMVWDTGPVPRVNLGTADLTIGGVLIAEYDLGVRHFVHSPAVPAFEGFAHDPDYATATGAFSITVKAPEISN